MIDLSLFSRPSALLEQIYLVAILSAISSFLCTLIFNKIRVRILHIFLVHFKLQFMLRGLAVNFIVKFVQIVYGIDDLNF